MEKRNKVMTAEVTTTAAIAAARVQRQTLSALRTARDTWEQSQTARLVAGAVAVLIVLGLALHQRFAAYSGADIIYFAARSRDLLAGHDPYAALVAQLGSHSPNTDVDIYMYDPFLYLLLSPLTALNFSLTWTVWALCNGVFLLVASVCGVKALMPRASVALGLVAAAAIALTGMGRYELFFGNVDILFMCLLAATFLAARRDRPVLAGVLLGLCTMVYVQSLPLLLFYLWKREYRTVLVGAATFVVTVGGSFLVAAPGSLGNFLTMGRYFVGSWAAIFINQSFYGIALHLFVPTAYSSAPVLHLAWLPPLLWVAATAGILVFAARIIDRTRISADSAQRAGLQFAAAVAALVLIFPLLEANTLIVLGLPLIVLAIVVASNPRVQPLRYLGIGVAVLYLVLALPLTTVSASRLGMRQGLHGLGLVLATFTAVPYFYLTIATGACVYLAIRYSKRATV